MLVATFLVLAGVAAVRGAAIGAHSELGMAVAAHSTVFVGNDGQ